MNATNGSKKMDLETSVQHIIGLLLWGISAVLTLNLFYTLSGKQLLHQITMVFLAIGLEGAKITTWRMGRHFRILSIVLISISGIASIGSALQILEYSRIETQYETELRVDRQSAMNLKKEEISNLYKQSEVLIERIADLPYNWVNTYKTLNTDLEALRNQVLLENIKLNSMQVATPAENTQKSMFELIGNLIMVEPNLIKFILLIVISGSLEWGALLLAGHNIGRKGCEINRTSIGHSRISPVQLFDSKAVTEWDYITVAQNGSIKPYIHGREKTASMLGISDYNAKVLLAKLIKADVVKVKGKRLILVDDWQEKMNVFKQ